MYLYQRLRDIREDADLKQEAVAIFLKITRQQYQLYESGKREIPFHAVIQLAQFYNVSLDYLAGLVPAPKPLYPNKPIASGNKSIKIGNVGNHSKIDIKQ